MATRERAVDRGTAKGVAALRAIGAEIRLSRRSSGLSLAAVASASRLSPSELSRIERAMVPGVGLLTLSEICAVVGLDLAARAYPGSRPIRDARHAALLERLHRRIHVSLRWSLEVPLPAHSEQRAWDALVGGSGWRLGIEAELNPIDGQGLLRRLNLKERDGLVDGVILLMPDTRQSRAFRREYAIALRQEFPIRARTVLDRLANGLHPGGSSVLVL